MSFTTITPTEIETGRPVASSTQTEVKGNFDNHESRISALEGGSSTVYPPCILRVNGYYGDLASYNGVLETTINFNITITGIRIIISDAGSVGTTECDIKVKSGVGAFTSVLTTKPSVSFSAGSHATSTNAVLDPTKVNLLAGDIIRLDLTSVQTGGRGFTVRIDYNKT